MAESLSDKLKALGVQVGSKNLEPRPKARLSYAIEAVLPGEVVQTPYGEVYRIESWYESSYQHGNICLKPDLDLRTLVQWGKVPHLADSRMGGFLFLDTETTGLGTGAGTFAFLVGIGHLAENGFHLIQLMMRDPREEPALLYLLNQHLSEFQALVTYNGKSFDVPLLTSRHIINGFTPPFPGLDHIDLLPLARRLWRNRLPSRALGDLEWQICGVVRTQEEVPGWMIPQIYFDYLSSGDARPLAGVIYHNAVDILSLAALFQHTSGLLSDPLHFTEPESLDLIAIARLYEELGQYEDAVNLYEFSLQLGMPEPFFIQTLDRFATLYRRHGEWEKTLRLWQKAVEHNQLSACVELAKYYEHQQRDPSLALQWAQRAFDLIDATVNGLASRRELKKELRHRIERLERKLNGKSPDAAG